MARRSNDDLGIAAGAFFLLLLVASGIATAWQTWTGRLLLLVVFGGGGWLAVTAFRWVRRRQRIHAQTLGELLALSPAAFEHAVAQLLRDEGHRRVQVHGGTGDLQADVTAVGADGAPVVVQCKRYALGDKVGSPKVQSFIGMATVHHRAARGVIVTTSSFTQPAIDLARAHRIELVDGDALVRRIQRQQPAPTHAADSPSTSPPPPPTPPPPQALPPPPAPRPAPPSAVPWTSQGRDAR